MSRQVSSRVGFAVLLVVSFVVLDWVYDYVIAFQSETNDCFFMSGRYFLLDFFDHPAGPLRYAGRFLGQFYHHTWLGALIVSGCITCFGVLFHGVLAKLKGGVRISETLFPCILLLALHTSAIYLVHDTLGLCVSCGAFLGYLSFRRKGPRRAYALAATPILYLSLGVYFWFFVAWVVVFEQFNSPWRTGLLFPVVYVLFSIAAPLVAWRWVFPIPLRSALICPIMFVPPAFFRTALLHYTAAQCAVDCFLGVVLSASLLLIPFSGRRASAALPAAPPPAGPAGRRRLVLALALPILILLLHSIRYDSRLDTLIACRQLYRDRQWDDLLEKARDNPSGDIRVQFMTNFALQHERRLLDEMFKYPQAWGARGLVLNVSGKELSSLAEDVTESAMYNSDLFYEMGHVNIAFRHAYNCMYDMGNTYDILKRMAQCSMANGNYAMAAKYLTMLEGTLFHNGFARRYMAIIADPDAASAEFADIRRRFPQVEGDISAHPVVTFRKLLDSDPDNRMAFDYLAAWSLLEKSLIATIPSQLKHLKRVGYTSLPTHLQEALLLLEKQTGAPADLQGFSYDQATRGRVERFIQDLSRYLGRQDARQQLYDLYGDTYMFHYYLVATPTDEPQPIREGFGGTPRQE